jgi:chromosome segregation ATPase
VSALLEPDPVELEHWRTRLADAERQREEIEESLRVLRAELTYIDNVIRTATAHLRRIG